MSGIDISVILAAGRGRRLKELSLEQPKPMTAVNDTAIIDKLISNMIQNNLTKIVVVVGYFAEKLKEHILSRFSKQAEFVFVENKIFDSTNNIYSLWLAKEYLNEGFYLFEADVFCTSPLIKTLTGSTAANVMLIDKFRHPMNGTVVTLDKNSIVKKMILKKEQHENFDYAKTFKTINFYKVSKEFVHSFFAQKIEDHIKKEDVNSFYELIFKEAVEKNIEFLGLQTGDSSWWEIDTYEDLQIAENMFPKGGKK